MKLSEFIEELEELKKEHGDKEIMIYMCEDPWSDLYEDAPEVKYDYRKEAFVITTV